MARFVRTFTKRLCIILNAVIAGLFLVACVNAWLHPSKWWFFSLLGLGFPVLLIMLVCFLVFWLMLRSKWAVLSALVLLLGLANIRVFLGLHFATSFKPEKPKGALRVLTWNVHWFDEHNKKNKLRKDYRKNMIAFIKEQNADILCFQEFLELGKSFAYSNTNAIVQLNYPYYYRVIDYGQASGGRFQAGVAIFSRFPIVDTQRVLYPSTENVRAAESLIGVDVQVNGKRIRVYTTHLQSVLFQKNDYRNLEIIKSADDSMVTASRSIIKKLKKGYAARGFQADVVRNKLDSCPYPEVVCGDFNDVPNSYTYFRIKGNRQDVFVRKGSGIGRSFTAVSPTLRIDYILADKAFDVLQYNRFLVPWSDHYPVVADLKLAEE
ncbi:endonuclease/exonuclease/phosphatase [Niastella caeni]|uniref:Endonuclease/exonuclease/phosphatase n=1 Tax=Niastella caeni TaxID=2569763 RepID=A0A4S8HNL9_9BACT|nr:endonuclease/exonuclease/phosphatase family protein [Niastella caeni]THU36978.1 endonuclease/exonuclease/phosphatase [Niastella caeni]